MSSFILTDEPGVASVQRWTGPLLLSTGFNAWVHRCGAWPGMCLHHHLQLFLDDHVQNSEAPYGSHMFWYLPLSDLFFNVKNDCKTNCVVQFAANYSKNWLCKPSKIWWRLWSYCFPCFHVRQQHMLSVSNWCHASICTRHKAPSQ